jgi:hypothetical protein
MGLPGWDAVKLMAYVRAPPRYTTSSHTDYSSTSNFDIVYNSLSSYTLSLTRILVATLILSLSLFTVRLCRYFLSGMRRRCALHVLPD